MWSKTNYYFFIRLFSTKVFDNVFQSLGFKSSFSFWYKSSYFQHVIHQSCHTFYCFIMDSEKFSLKWNDFQQTVVNSFKTLRKEEDFFNVTLVSDDEDHISAHKLVLSACSTFFKSILRKNETQHPIIYLSGIKSAKLQLIVDYIYQGEVQVYQEEIEEFLTVAKKLKIEGLMSSNHLDSKSDKRHESEQKYLEETNTEAQSFDSFEDIAVPKIEPQVPELPKPNQKEKIEFSFTDVAELDQQILQMMQVADGKPSCTVCGKTSSSRKDLKRHIETHIEGLSFPCDECDKSFRSRHSLRTHMSLIHK